MRGNSAELMSFMVAQGKQLARDRAAMFQHWASTTASLLQFLTDALNTGNMKRSHLRLVDGCVSLANDIGAWESSHLDAVNARSVCQASTENRISPAGVQDAVHWRCLNYMHSAHTPNLPPPTDMCTFDEILFLRVVITASRLDMLCKTFTRFAHTGVAFCFRVILTPYTHLRHSVMTLMNVFL